MPPFLNIGNMQEAIIAFLGVVIGFLLSICWDQYKSYKKYKSLVKLTLRELKQNLGRMDKVFKGLPEEIKNKIEPDGISVSLTDGDIQKMPWNFPTPYITEVWKTFISSGLTIDLPEDIYTKLYKTYDNINSINFLGNMSVDIFQIISQENNLNSDTNKNLDRFCRVGPISQQLIARKETRETIEKIEQLTERLNKWWHIT